MPLRGPLYRLTLSATDPDPHERVACVSPARNRLGLGRDRAGRPGRRRRPPRRPARLTAVLRLDAAGAVVRFEVEDQGAALPRRVASLGDDQAVTGRGLLMVEALAVRWGSDPTGTGKVVWAELVLPAPLDPSAIVAQGRQATARSDYLRAASMGTAPRRAR
ncbi:ATP-binding protein [Streptomyces sp. XY431]|uniref:ATP-binding protein n=1 Tax=Streptomyces sp. XY431 TaxID=1415562 RepID=UPI001331BC6B|nr:ATP-binding protein [Streptomyces sp. XY431]